MATINVTTRFDINETVWLKTVLDQNTDTSEKMKKYFSFQLDKMLFKIYNIKIIKAGSEQKIFYSLIPFLDDTGTPNTAMSNTSVVDNILEENLYSFDEGKVLYETKQTDFNNYLIGLQ